MKCPNCGEGELYMNIPCTKCKITYKNLLHGIRHSEITRLIGKFDEDKSTIEEMEVYTSMLAAELLSSTLIMPGTINDGRIKSVKLPGPDNKMYLALYTDMGELEVNTGDYMCFINTWKEYLNWLPEDNGGFIINGICYLHRDFLDNFFND